MRFSVRNLVEYALQRGSRARLLHFAFGFFALYTLFRALTHVPWRDEAQPWLFARDLDLTHLFYMGRHNGHPILWFLCVKAIEATGVNYLGMMVLNWLFCVGAIALLFYRSTLPLAAKIIFAYAPICIFEIAFTARDYAPALLLIFLAATLYPTARTKPLRFSLVLALLASTNVFAAAVFVGISTQFLLEQGCDFEGRTFSLRPLFTKYLAANMILTLGATLLVLQVAPIRFPGDTYPNVVNALAPQPSHLLNPFFLLVSFLALALVLIPKKPRRPWILGGFPIFLLVCVPVIAYGQTARHLFMIVAAITYFCWIYFDAFLAADSWLIRKYGPNGLKTLVCVLLAAAVSGAKPDHVSSLLHRPYDARNAAQAIIEAKLDRPDTLLVTTDSFRAMPLFLFLKAIPSAYVPPDYGLSPQSFAQDAYLPRFLTHPTALEDIKPTVLDLAAKNPGRTIVLAVTGPHPVAEPAAFGPGYRLEPLYATPLSPRYLPSSEAYQIYILKRSP